MFCLLYLFEPQLFGELVANLVCHVLHKDDESWLSNVVLLDHLELNEAVWHLLEQLINALVIAPFTLILVKRLRSLLRRLTRATLLWWRW